MQALPKKEKPATVWNKNFTCIFLAELALGISTNCTSSLVTSYATLFGVTPMLVGIVAGLYYGVSFMARPVSGPLQMRGDRRILLIITYILGAISYAGYAISSSIYTLMVFRFIGGLQCSIVGSLNLTLAAAVVPQERMASGLGYFSVAGIIGSALGPALGIFIRDWAGSYGGEKWGYAVLFLFASAVCLAALVPCWLLDPQKAERSERGKNVWYRQIIEKHSIVPACIMMLMYLSYHLFVSYLVLYAVELGISGVSSFFLIYSAVLVVTRPALNKLMDKYDVFTTLFPFSVIFAIAFIGVGFSKTIVGLLAWAVVSAIGFGVVRPGAQMLCLRSATEARQAVASNTLFFGLDLGCTIGPMIFGGYIYPLLGSYSKMYLAACVPVVLALILLILYRPHFVRRRKEIEQKEKILPQS